MTSGTWQIIDNKIIFEVGVKKVTPQIKKEIEENILKAIRKGIAIRPVERLSYDQLKLIQVLCYEYGQLLGYESQELLLMLKALFAYREGLDIFSLSNAKKEALTVEQAAKFTDFIITHALENHCNLIIHDKKSNTKRKASTLVNDIKRYIIACLRLKKCCVCGNHADLHHSPALGIGYEHDTGFLTGFLSLCREHHTEAHNKGLKEFEELYHIEPIWLNENLLFDLLDVYPNHFKKFRSDNKEKIMERK